MVWGTFLASAGIRLASAWLRGSSRPPTPALPEGEADTQLRASPVAKRWIVGRVRVRGDLARHVGVLHSRSAEVSWKTTQGNIDDLNLRYALATEYLETRDYFVFALSEGETFGVEDIVVDGVRMVAANEPGRAEAALLRDGEITVSDPRNRVLSGDRVFLEEDYPTPFWGVQFVGSVISDGVGPFTVSRAQQLAPMICAWQHTGEEDDGSGKKSRALRKLISVYDAAGASDAEKDQDAVSTAHGYGITWVLVRLTQTNASYRAAPGTGVRSGPWRKLPNLEFVVRGKGTVIPTATGTLDDPLDGNPAKAAYWYLTQRMGVDPQFVDPVYEQSIAICDEEVVAMHLNLHRSFVGGTVFVDGAAGWANQDAYNVIREFAENNNLQFNTADQQLDAVVSWKQDKIDQVVRRYTGLATNQVSAETRERIVAEWNRKYSGTFDADGVRKRYVANGVIDANADHRRTLDELARAMLGSIEEHGGTWYIRAGSKAIRPIAQITDDDIVGEEIGVVLEPSADDQFDVLHASLAQDASNDEFQPRSLPPVDRRDAALGFVNADDTPASLLAQLPQRQRRRDLGELKFVTDPRQARELMDVFAYQTRWNTRTFQLVVRPGYDFEFYRLGKGAPVLLSSKAQGLIGPQVGERLSSIRCVVIERPRITDDGNISLVLRQQDEDAFGEKFGLVFDYHEAPDRFFAPITPPPPVLGCELPENLSFDAGEEFSIVTVPEGGTGRRRFALAGTITEFATIDPTTGAIGGTIPLSGVSGTYTVVVSVRDDGRQTASCSTTIEVAAPPTGTGGPYITTDPRRLYGQAGQTTTGEVVIVHPASSSGELYDKSGRARRRSRSTKVFVGDWAIERTDAVNQWFTITERFIRAVVPGALANATYEFPVRAYVPNRPDVPEITGVIALVVRTPVLAATFSDVHVRQHRFISLTSFTDNSRTVTGGTAPYSYAVKATTNPTKVLPAGLAMNSLGDISGTCTAPVRTYTPTIVITDSTGVTLEKDLNVIVSDVGASCHIRPGAAFTVVQGATFQKRIDLDGFSGTIQGSKFGGPDWVYVEQAADGNWYLTNQHVDPELAGLTAPNAPVGTYNGVVQFMDSNGTEASCFFTVIITGTPAPELTVNATPASSEGGGTWLGHATGSGGSGGYTFSILGQRSNDPFGFQVNRLTGAYQGVGPATDGTKDYVIEVRDSDGDTATTTITATSTASPRTPPGFACRAPAVNPRVRPGETVKARVICSLPGAAQINSQANASGVAWGSGTGWRMVNPDEPTAVIDATPPGASAAQLELTVVAPAGATNGDYTFSATLGPATGGGSWTPQTASVTVTVAGTAVTPIVVNPNDLALRVPANIDFSQDVRFTGGDEARTARFTGLSAPSWFSLSSAGRMSFSGRAARGRSYRISYTITRGTAVLNVNATLEIFAVRGTEEDLPVIRAPRTLRLQAGRAMNQQIGSSLTGAVTYTVSGPSWLSVDGDRLKGTAAGEGVQNAIVTATNGDDTSYTSIAIDVVPAGFQIRYDDVRETEGTRFQALPVAYSPNPPVSWGAHLGVGMEIDRSTGAVTGTVGATRKEVAVFATDANGLTADAVISVEPVVAAGFVSEFDETDPIVPAGTEVNIRLVTVGGSGNYSVDVVGGPDWCWVSTEGVAGRAVAGQGGLLRVRVTDVDDGGSVIADVWFTVLGDEPLSLELPTLSGVNGSPIPAGLFATLSGGAGGYEYELVTFPAGVTINTETGEFGGTFPSVAGLYPIRVRGEDADGTPVFESGTLEATGTGFRINPATVTARIGSTINLPLSVAEGYTVQRWAKESGPAYITVAEETGLLRGRAPSAPTTAILQVYALSTAGEETRSAIPVVITGPAMTATISAITIYRERAGSTTATVNNAQFGWTARKKSGDARMTVSPAGRVSWTDGFGSDDTTVTPLVVEFTRTSDNQKVDVTVAPSITDVPNIQWTASPGARKTSTTLRGDFRYFYEVATVAGGSTSVTISPTGGTGTLTVRWQDSNFLSSSGATTSFAFPSGGTIPQTFTITDDAGVPVTGVVVFQVQRRARPERSVSVPSATFQVNAPIRLQCTVQNGRDGETLRWAEVGDSFPTGLVISPSTGIISGSVSTADVYTLRVTDGKDTGQGTLTITAAPPPVLISCPADVTITGTTGASISEQIADPTGATGAVSYSGTPPTGVTLSASGAIGGAHPATAGTRSFVVTVSDAGSGSSCTLTVRITTAVAGSLTCAVAPTIRATVGRSYSAQIPNPAGATGTLTFAARSGLFAPPSGMSIGSDGAITGTGSASNAARVSYHYTVTDAGTGASCNGEGTLETASAPTLSCSGAPAISVGVGEAYSVQIAAPAGATGTVTYEAASGNPSHMSISSTGLVSGTAPSEAGLASYGYTASDAGTGLSCSSTGSFTAVRAGSISAPRPPAISVQANAAISAQCPAVVGATGTVTYAKASGPAGLNISATGAISGRLAAGNYTYSYRASDAGTGTSDTSPTATITVSRVTGALSVSLDNTRVRGVTGTVYRAVALATGGTPPYTFSLKSGSSSAVSISGSTVTLAAQSSTGTFSYTVVATDADGDTAEVAGSFVIAVGAALTVTEVRPSIRGGSNNARVSTGLYQASVSGGGGGDYGYRFIVGATTLGTPLGESSDGSFAVPTTGEARRGFPGSIRAVCIAQPARGRVLSQKFDIRTYNVPGGVFLQKVDFSVPQGATRILRVPVAAGGARVSGSGNFTWQALYGFNLPWVRQSSPALESRRSEILARLHVVAPDAPGEHYMFVDSSISFVGGTRQRRYTWIAIAVT